MQYSSKIKYWKKIGARVTKCRLISINKFNRFPLLMGSLMDVNDREKCIYVENMNASSENNASQI